MVNMQEDKLYGVALCAGGAGLEMGLKIIFGERYQTILLIEREAYAAATLVARMEDKTLDAAPIWDDVSTFDGKPWRKRIHILSAGFPCQPFSLAGKRQGTSDERWIWKDIIRIIREFECPIVFLENVPGLALPSEGLETDICLCGWSDRWRRLHLDMAFKGEGLLQPSSSDRDVREGVARAKPDAGAVGRIRKTKTSGNREVGSGLYVDYLRGFCGAVPEGDTSLFGPKEAARTTCDRAQRVATTTEQQSPPSELSDDAGFEPEGIADGCAGHQRPGSICVLCQRRILETSEIIAQSNGLGTVLGDLAESGFNAEWCLLRAEDVGGAHERARLFILGYSRNFARLQKHGQARRPRAAAEGHETHRGPGEPSNELEHTDNIGSVRREGGAGQSMADAASRRCADQSTSEGSLHERTVSERAGSELADAADGGTGSVSARPRSRGRGTADVGRAGAELADAPLSSSERQQQQRVDLSGAGSAAMGHTAATRCEERTRDLGDVGQELEATQRAGLPVFPPGPGLGGYGVLDDIRELLRTDPERAWQRYQAELRNTLEWCRILEEYPALEPSFCRVAHELANRVERLRLTGGGVVPLAGAIAFHILATRLGLNLEAFAKEDGHG